MPLWPQDIFHGVGAVLATICGLFVWYAARVMGEDRPKTIAVVVAIVIFVAVAVLTWVYVPPPVGLMVCIV